jgi:hypothetical protein
VPFMFPTSDDRMANPLGALHNLQSLRGLESLAKDGIPGGNFSDGVGMDHVSAVGKCVAEGNLDVGIAGFQREMLVAYGGRSSVVGDGYDDHGQIEGVVGAIGDLEGAVDPIVMDLCRFKPFQQQRGGDYHVKFFVEGVCGMAGIFDFYGQFEGAGLGGASGQQAFGSESDAVGKIASGYAPDIGWSAAGGMEKKVEFHAGFDGRQGLVNYAEWGRLRNQQTAEKN